VTGRASGKRIPVGLLPQPLPYRLQATPTRLNPLPPALTPLREKELREKSRPIESEIERKEEPNKAAMVAVMTKVLRGWRCASSSKL